MSTFALAIHGGCGVMPSSEMPAELAKSAREGLRASLDAGHAILARGGSALDAVQAAVAVMEDHPAFNAGHGSVFNAEGGHELDASIMDGASLKAGAVAGIRVARNPITVARGLLEDGDPLFLQGDGADRYARAKGFKIVDQAYFGTELRRRMLAEMKALTAKGQAQRANEAQKHGTVGAVALDQAGHLAAATSTGGYSNKPLGRVGDTPIIGAGTYANDATCAISATGKGEFFIRKVLAHEIHARMAYLKHDLAKACDDLVMRELPEWGSGAGLVAVDAQGRVTLPYNTSGMYRGSVTSTQAPTVAIYAD